MFMFVDGVTSKRTGTEVANCKLQVADFRRKELLRSSKAHRKVTTTEKALETRQGASENKTRGYKIDNKKGKANVKLRN